MAESMMNLIHDYANAKVESAIAATKIAHLHRIVDEEDISTAKGGYHVASIDTKVIRMLFDWDECAEARNAMDEKEAALQKPKDEAVSDDA